MPNLDEQSRRLVRHRGKRNITTFNLAVKLRLFVKVLKIIYGKITLLSLLRISSNFRQLSTMGRAVYLSGDIPPISQPCCDIFYTHCSNHNTSWSPDLSLGVWSSIFPLRKQANPALHLNLSGSSLNKKWDFSNRWNWKTVDRQH